MTLKKIFKAAKSEAQGLVGAAQAQLVEAQDLGFKLDLLAESLGESENSERDLELFIRCVHLAITVDGDQVRLPAYPVRYEWKEIGVHAIRQLLDIDTQLILTMPYISAAVLKAISKHMEVKTDDDLDYDLLHKLLQTSELYLRITSLPDLENIRIEFSTTAPRYKNPRLDNLIRETFLANGFTIKEGQTDLKDYVYNAVYELLEKLDG